MVRVVFPKLVRETYHLQIMDHLRDRRVRTIMHTFITCLRRKVLTKRLAQAYQWELTLRLISNVFVELRVWQKRRQLQ
jgi:hypothetical protein